MDLVDNSTKFLQYIQEKIIKTDEVIKLFDSKRKELKKLDIKHKKLIQKLLLKNDEVSNINNSWEKKVEELKAENAELVKKHNEYVNGAEIKYQSCCLELSELNKIHDNYKKKHEKAEQKEKTNHNTKKLQNTLTETKKLLEESIRKYEELQSSSDKIISDLKIECKNHVDKNNEVLKQLAKMRLESDELKKSQKPVSNTPTELKLREQVTELKSKLEYSQIELDMLNQTYKTDIEEMKKKHHEEIEKIKSKIDTKDEYVKEFENEKKILNDRIKELRNNIHEINEKHILEQNNLKEKIVELKKIPEKEIKTCSTQTDYEDIFNLEDILNETRIASLISPMNTDEDDQSVFSEISKNGEKVQENDILEEPFQEIIEHEELEEESVTVIETGDQNRIKVRSSSELCSETPVVVDNSTQTTEDLQELIEFKFQPSIILPKHNVLNTSSILNKLKSRVTKKYKNNKNKMLNALRSSNLNLKTLMQNYLNANNKVMILSPSILNQNCAWQNYPPMFQPNHFQHFGQHPQYFTSFSCNSHSHNCNCSSNRKFKQENIIDISDSEEELRSFLKDYKYRVLNKYMTKHNTKRRKVKKNKIKKSVKRLRTSSESTESDSEIFNNKKTKKRTTTNNSKYRKIISTSELSSESEVDNFANRSKRNSKPKNKFEFLSNSESDNKTNNPIKVKTELKNSKLNQRSNKNKTIILSESESEDLNKRKLNKFSCFSNSSDSDNETNNSVKVIETEMKNSKLKQIQNKNKAIILSESECEDIKTNLNERKQNKNIKTTKKISLPKSDFISKVRHEKVVKSNIFTKPCRNIKTKSKEFVLESELSNSETELRNENANNKSEQLVEKKEIKEIAGNCDKVTKSELLNYETEISKENERINKNDQLVEKKEITEISKNSDKVTKSELSNLETEISKENTKPNKNVELVEKKEIKEISKNSEVTKSELLNCETERSKANTKINKSDQLLGKKEIKEIVEMGDKLTITELLFSETDIIKENKELNKTGLLEKKEIEEICKKSYEAKQENENFNSFTIEEEMQEFPINSSEENIESENENQFRTEENINASLTKKENKEELSSSDEGFQGFEFETKTNVSEYLNKFISEEEKSIHGDEPENERKCTGTSFKKSGNLLAMNKRQKAILKKISVKTSRFHVNNDNIQTSTPNNKRKSDISCTPNKRLKMLLFGNLSDSDSDVSIKDTPVTEKNNIDKELHTKKRISLVKNVKTYSTRSQDNHKADNEVIKVFKNIVDEDNTTEINKPQEKRIFKKPVRGNTVSSAKKENTNKKNTVAKEIIADEKNSAVKVPTNFPSQLFDSSIHNTDRIEVSSDISTKVSSEFTKVSSDIFTDVDSDYITYNPVERSQQNNCTSVKTKPKTPEISIDLAQKLILDVATLDWDKALLTTAANYLSDKDPKIIAKAIINQATKDFSTQFDKSFTPPAPLLTFVQQKILVLVNLIEQNSPRFHSVFLEVLEHRLLSERKIEVVHNLTRIFVCQCKFKYDLERVRMFCCHAAFYMGDLISPLMYIILTSWGDVLPNADKAEDIPLLKTLVYVIQQKKCTTPGYNNRNLLKLLNDCYGYKFGIFTNEEIMNKLITSYLASHSHSTYISIVLLCKSLPSKWTYTQIKTNLLPLVAKGEKKEMTVSLINRLMENFNVSSEQEYISDIRDNLAVYVSAFGLQQ